MTHPVTEPRSGIHVGDLNGGKPLAAVRVESVRRQGGTVLRVRRDAGVSLLKADILMVQVPEAIQVVDDDDDEPVYPTKGKHFYMTLNTFDPHHAVTEAP